MIIVSPGPVLADGSLLVNTAEGRIFQLTRTDGVFQWNDFGYPNASRCIELANSIFPASDSATFLTALDGHLYELDTNTNQYIDHGLPPNADATDVPQPGFAYVAGCVAAPIVDPHQSTEPTYKVLSTDGRLLNYSASVSGTAAVNNPSVWGWDDLGCFNQMPFVRRPLPTTLGPLCVAEDGTLALLSTALGGSWQSVASFSASTSQLAIQPSSVVSAGFYVWIVDGSGSLWQVMPDLQSGEWPAYIYPEPGPPIIGSPLVGSGGGHTYLYVYGSDGSISLLVDPDLTASQGSWVTIYPAGNLQPISPPFLLYPTILCFGANDGTLVFLTVVDPTQPADVLNIGAPPLNIAICLSGGGAQGDFEVGACEYLYGLGIRPNVLCGTSVGALNAAKLAEGGPRYLEGLLALIGLGQIWLGLQQNSDFYEPEDWLQQLESAERYLQEVDTLSPTGAIISLLSALVLFPVVSLPVIAWFNPKIFTVVQDMVTLLQDIQNVETSPSITSLFNLNPTRQLIMNNLDVQKVSQSGVGLWIAMVQLETGLLFWMTEHGDLFNGQGTYALQLGVLASASDPVVFPPVDIGDGNHYVDGGVRATLPIWPAVPFGNATEIFAIDTTQFNTSWSLNQPGPFGTSSGLLNVASRSVACATNQIIDDALASVTGLPGRRLTIFQPNTTVHDEFTIHPGLISISIDYGFMKAGDVYAPGYGGPTTIEIYPYSGAPFDIPVSMIPEQIVAFRVQNITAEAGAVGATPYIGGAPTGTLTETSDASLIPFIRWNKQQIASLLAMWLQRHGAIPTNIYQDAVVNWERNQWPPGWSSNYPSPWDDFLASSGPSVAVAAATPPTLNTTGRFPGYPTPS